MAPEIEFKGAACQANTLSVISLYQPVIYSVEHLAQSLPNNYQSFLYLSSIFHQKIYSVNISMFKYEMTNIFSALSLWFIYQHINCQLFSFFSYAWQWPGYIYGSSLIFGRIWSSRVIGIELRLVECKASTVLMLKSLWPGPPYWCLIIKIIIVSFIWGNFTFKKLIFIWQYNKSII